MSEMSENDVNNVEEFNEDGNMVAMDNHDLDNGLSQSMNFSDNISHDQQNCLKEKGNLTIYLELNTNDVDKLECIFQVMNEKLKKGTKIPHLQVNHQTVSL